MCKTRIYFTQAEFVANYRERYAIRKWKQHTARHGNVPMVVPCSICSGKERKVDIKLGKWNPKRPSKVLRDGG